MTRVRGIGYAAFDGCGGLTSVTIPDSVTSIGDSAFSYCSGLTSVTIPDGVTSIGDLAFYRCSALADVTIPNSVKYIGRDAFSACNAALFDTTTILGVKLVDGWAVGCTRVLSGDLNLTDVRGIGYAAFSDCSGLKSVTVSQYVCTNQLSWVFQSSYQTITNVVISDGVTSVGDFAFSGCSGLTSVTIPDGVKSIGSSAFSGCSGLTSVTIPGSVKHVGPSAFYGCDALINVVIEDGVESFGYCAFSECNALKHVMIPASVTNVGSAAAFTRCGGMLSYEVADGNPSYKSVSGLLLTKDGKELVCGINGDVIIPDGVTRIGPSAFEGCVGLTSVTIPDSVTGILQRTFVGCSGLQRATIPGGVILSFTFSNCNSLESVVFMGDAPLCLVGFRSVAAGCSAYVSPKSTGWGVEVGGVWNGLTLRYWPEVLTPVTSDAEVVGVLSVFVDGAIAEEVTTVAEYESFKEWIDEKNLYQPAVVASPHAAAAYLLGAERLFENEPTIEIGELAIAEGDSSGTMVMTVAVTVKDGERVVSVDAEKVAAMFEATSDLGDWTGAAKLTPTVATSGTDASGKMSFTVTPGDGTSSKAFLRIKR